jgi:hypothetical protein
VPPTTEMMDTHIQIMVEVLTILGIATKEIKQGRMGEVIQYEYVTAGLTMFRKIQEEADWKD